MPPRGALYKISRQQKIVYFALSFSTKQQIIKLYILKVMHKNFYDKDKIQILHKNKLRFIIIHKSKQKELNNTMN